MEQSSKMPIFARVSLQTEWRQFRSLRTVVRAAYDGRESRERARHGFERAQGFVIARANAACRERRRLARYEQRLGQWESGIFAEGEQWTVIIGRYPPFFQEWDG